MQSNSYSLNATGSPRVRENGNTNQMFNMILKVDCEIIWAPRADNYCRLFDHVNLELATKLAGTHGNNSSDKCRFFARRYLPEIH